MEKDTYHPFIGTTLTITIPKQKKIRKVVATFRGQDYFGFCFLMLQKEKKNMGRFNKVSY